MRSVIYLVEAEKIRMSPEAFWLAGGIKAHLDPSVAKMRYGTDRRDSDALSLYVFPQRVGVIHFLGPHDDDGKRVRFCVNDLTQDNFLIQAAEAFSEENNHLLQKIE